MAYLATYSVQPDGREHLEVLNTEAPRNAYNPSHWTTVRNINGSCDFMRDGGGWMFFPWHNREFMAAVETALRAGRQAEAAR